MYSSIFFDFSFRYSMQERGGYMLFDYSPCDSCLCAKSDYCVRYNTSCDMAMHFCDRCRSIVRQNELMSDKGCNWLHPYPKSISDTWNTDNRTNSTTLTTNHTKIEHSPYADYNSYMLEYNGTKWIPPERDSHISKDEHDINSNKEKESNFMNDFMNGMFGKVAHGLCRLSMNGGIAVKTSDGKYKSYNLKTGRLTNCSNFVFDIGEDFFFVIPTNKVEKGDIILVSGKPKCVIGVEDNAIKVINYDDSTVDTILPERHIFMGNTYFYGKIVSMFGKDIFKGKNGTNKIMKYMMLSEMMRSGSGNGNFGNMLPLMMLGGGSFDNIFSGIFDFDSDDEDIEEVTDDEDGDA